MYKVDQAIDVRQDELINVISLQEYLHKKLNNNSMLELLQFPSGYSNLTYLLKMGNQNMVLRRPPHGANIKSGHDMRREFKILSALTGHFNKIPLPIIFCDDKSIIGDEFYIMEKVNGTIFRGSQPQSDLPKPELIPKLVNSFVYTFSEIHSLKVQEIGLQDFGKPEDYVIRQVKGWIKRYNNAKTHDFDGLDKTIQWLSKNIPNNSEACLIHNDFKFDNLMFEIGDKVKVNAVLDWEMATIGDPLMDLGTSLGYWIHETDPEMIQELKLNITCLKGTPSREELVHLYGENSGRSVQNILFYFVFGLFKIAGIVQQIYYRYQKGFTKDQRFKELDKGVELLGVMACQAIQKRKIDYLF
ncbi:MAG: phosphotransferase family protein [Flavobacteriaceae bacterium]|nr:phosphotransferase family protein [Flavobacteriaceae bacterium]